VRLRLYRYDPAVDQAPRYETYEVPYVPRMRIMDALDHVHETLAVDIGYRWLCGSKKCGSCAVNVNGSPKLACWEPAEAEMTIEPLGNLPVVRDLVTSRAGYEAWLAKLVPTLVRKTEYPGFPEPLSSTDVAATAHLRECIQCLACQGACPVLKAGEESFAGPALLVALSELAQDPRDGGDRARLASDVANVFKCVSCYECERVCPAGIPIVREAIEPLKRLAYGVGTTLGAQRARAFLDDVKQRGHVSAVAVGMKTRKMGLADFGLALRLARHGKLNPLDALPPRPSGATESLRQTYEASMKEDK
jgi:succinate dehydrogenase/fumarate reductase iron-sulfur protein